MNWSLINFHFERMPCPWRTSFRIANALRAKMFTRTKLLQSGLYSGKDFGRVRLSSPAVAFRNEITFFEIEPQRQIFRDGNSNARGCDQRLMLVQEFFS